MRPIVSYPPEPVLAMAALRKLKNFPSEILNNLIRMKGFDIYKGLGEIDEFLAKILFLLSLPTPDLSHPNHSVEKMFRDLFGYENMRKLNSSENACILLKGLVCFSYFTTFEKFYDHPYKSLGVLVRLHAALSIPRRKNSEPTLIIPVVLDDGKLSSITVQLTRTLRTHSPVEVHRGTTGDASIYSSDIPRLNIILNIDPRIAEKFEVQEHPHCTSVLVEGWNTCFKATLQCRTSLQDPICELLSLDRRDFIPIEVKFLDSNGELNVMRRLHGTESHPSNLSKAPL